MFNMSFIVLHNSFKTLSPFIDALVYICLKSVTLWVYIVAVFIKICFYLFVTNSSIVIIGFSLVYVVLLGPLSDDGDNTTTALDVNSGATMTSQGGGSDVTVTCKRRRRASSLDCLSLIVDSLATERSTVQNSAFRRSTATTTGVGWWLYSSLPPIQR